MLHQPQVAFDKPSLLMRVATAYLRMMGKPLAPDKLADFKASLEARALPSAAPMPRSLQRLCEVREETVAGKPVFHLKPRIGVDSTIVIYTHGGAYVNPLRREHWQLIEAFIRSTGATFIVPTYPLAPENDHTGAFKVLDRVYASACRRAHPRDVVLMGDSAGGGLALAQAMRYRDTGQPLPGRIVLIAPWLDITMSNPGAASAEKVDVMLGIDALRWCGTAWAGDVDPSSPLLSPIEGDLSDLPPIDVYQGTHDLFIADARELFRRVIDAGGRIQVFEYAEAFHVFPAATFTAEAKDVFHRIQQSLD